MVILLAATTVAGRSQRELAQQRLLVQQGIHDALTEVTRIRDRAQDAAIDEDTALTLAREHLQRAVALAETDPADPELVVRVRQLSDELDDQQRDRELLAALDAAWLTQANVDVSRSVFAKGDSLPLLRNALEAYGIVVNRTPPQEVAARIRTRPKAVQHQLLAALEEWRTLAKPLVGFFRRVESGKHMIVAVTSDSPAGRDGRLSIGDQLIGVGQGREGEIVDIRTLTSPEVRDLVQGESGTIVRLQVIPAGENDPKVYEIQRDPTQAWLTTVLGAADADPWRRQLRDAMSLQDNAEQRSTLEGLAVDADVDGATCAGSDPVGRKAANSGRGGRGDHLVASSAAATPE